MKIKSLILRLALAFTVLSVIGCEGYYSANTGYYGPGPYYGGYPGSVTVAVGDQPYYVHGGGYYAGRTYYVWRPGHWRWRHGNRVWIHGRYIVRGY